MRKARLLLGAAAFVLGAASAASAQNFPDRPITMIVPYIAGSSNDNTARLLANEVGQSLKTPFVVSNIAGGSGVLGTQDVINSKPDGHTLLWTGPSVLLTPLLQNTPPYDYKKLTPVIYATSSPYVFIVNKDVPAKDIKEFVAYAKSKPGALNYGTGGPTSTTNLYMMRFMRMSGVKLADIAYRGGPESMTALLSNEIQVLPGQPELAMTVIDRVRVLASASEARNSLLPDVPTFRETGMDFVVSVWGGIFAPTATPPAVVARLNQEFDRALKSAAVKDRLVRLGFDLHGGTPAQFAAFLAEEEKQWGQAIIDGNIPKL